MTPSTNTPTRRAVTPLAARLASALRSGDWALELLDGAEPVDRRDLLLTLLAIHDLHTASLEVLGGTERWQHHPVVAGLKGRLVTALIDELDRRDAAADSGLPDDAVAAMRALAARGLVPDVYTWAAEQADWPELLDFLALEGGPDGGFDDLVAACQIGLSGEAKLELARNYWDEMGRGDIDAVHTNLHHLLTEAADLPSVPRHLQPDAALERSVLGSLLATNRYLQPEMVGALGLLELQAGPRCRKVVTAMERLDAPEGAKAFYVEHAVADPRHGKAWVDHAVAPLVVEHPGWAARIVRGARWRSLVNVAFFDEMARQFLPSEAHTVRAG